MSGHELIMMWIMEELHTHATWAMRMSELCLRQATAARTAEARSASARARASGRMVVGEGRWKYCSVVGRTLQKREKPPSAGE